jgi:hypothetical protein
MLERRIHALLKANPGYRAIQASTAWAPLPVPSSWPRSATSLAFAPPTPCARGRD